MEKFGKYLTDAAHSRFHEPMGPVQVFEMANRDATVYRYISLWQAGRIEWFDMLEGCYSAIRNEISQTLESELVKDKPQLGQVISLSLSTLDRIQAENLKPESDLTRVSPLSLQSVLIHRLKTALIVKDAAFKALQIELMYSAPKIVYSKEKEK